MSERDAAIAALIAQGIAAQNARRFGEAERAYRTALQFDSSHPQALALLGTLAGIAGRLPLAVDLFLRALPRDPENADLYHNLGETYRQLGDIAKALPAFNRAIELRPNHLEAYRSAADAAIAAAEAAVPSDPRQARELRRIAAQYLLRLAHKQHAQRLIGVEASLREAATLDPENAAVLSALGAALHEKNCPTEAIEILQRAIAANPQDALAYNNLGNAYSTLQRWDEMETAFRTAVALDPKFTLAQRNLQSISLMRWLYDDASTPATIYERHRDWAKEIEATVGVSGDETRFPNQRDPDRQLRIAYLSPDFRRHSVAYFLHPLLTHHDPKEVAIFCYAEVEEPDAMTERLRQTPSTWRDTVSLGDDALRQQLRADGIDIAIDLAGHTARNRLRALAVRAAPVTATWLGYPATTGLRAIDWRITDAVADPPGAERYYTEKLMRLEDGFLCYEALGEDIPAISPPPALAAGFPTFGCFNAPQKISAATVTAWAEILKAVPEARLMLKGPALSDRGLRDLFLERFARHGIDGARLVLRDYAASTASHLGMYAEIDIALDPFPYNGTTTSCEAMWMGVPVVALIGDRHTGRVGFDLLSRLDLAELAAPDTAGYVATATALARDLPRLEAMRKSLRQRMRASPLCDAPRFARAFEQALRAMWRAWCER